MKRDIEQKLYAWKNDENHRPLLIGGVMGSGKSWCLQIFGKIAFQDIAYFDFNAENGEELQVIFENPEETDRILHELSTFILGREITPGKTLVIFDNVQLCPPAIESLRYFAINKSDLHVIAAGRSLSQAFRSVDVSELVGRVRHLELGPLSFEEFVKLCGGENYLKELRLLKPGQKPSALYSRAMQRYLRDYYIVGGMPEAVDTWIETRDYAAAKAVQDKILEQFANWMEELTPSALSQRVKMIWQSMPHQLSGKTHKFQYSQVQRGLRSKDLDQALRVLEDAGMFYRQELIGDPDMPLSLSADTTCFRMYLCDVGLLRRVMGIPADDILSAETDFTDKYPALTENYVYMQLHVLGYSSWFWRSGNIAELDFVIEHGKSPLAIDLKSIANTKSKSLRSFIEKYQPETVLRLSARQSGEFMSGQTKVTDVPLYMLWGNWLQDLQ